MFRKLSITVALSMLAGVVAPTFANELVQNGDFGTVTTWAVLPISNAPPWVGADSTLLSYDVVNTELHVWFATANNGDGLLNKQCAFQPFATAMTDNTHYTLSADLRAWTGGGPETATAQIRIYALDSDLGGSWQYFPTTISYTATTSADISNFYHVTAQWDVPAGFNMGSQQGVALWGLSNGPAGWAWDNISLQGTPAPEPATMALLGVGGVLALIRRRRTA